MSVSYTHLDVYKRQAEDHIEANLANSPVYVRDLQKIYPSAKGDVQAMKDVNINVMENEFVSRCV